MNKRVLAFICILFPAFVVVCMFVLTGAAQGFNDVVYQRIAQANSPAVTFATITISNTGDWFVYVPLALLLLILPKARRNIGIPAASVLTASAIANSLLKQLFHVARPDVPELMAAAGYGFPSGHVMNGTAFVGICAYLFCRYSQRKGLMIIVVALSVLFMLLMGFARIYLGAHSATDVIGGYLGGLVVVSVAVLIINSKSGAKKKPFNDSRRKSSTDRH